MSNAEAEPVAMQCGPSATQLVEVLTARDVPLGGVRAMHVRRTLSQRERTLIGAWCLPTTTARSTSRPAKAAAYEILVDSSGQPFTAPEERPPMMCRCMIAKISRIGATASSRVGKTIS
jgi:hypothetical protein